MRVSRTHVKNVDIDHRGKWGKRGQVNGVAEHDQDVDPKRREDLGEVSRRYIDDMGWFAGKRAACDQPRRRIISTDHDRLHA
jgi:hypothetical protein